MSTTTGGPFTRKYATSVAIRRNIIETEHIDKFFGEGENRVHILKDITMTIKDGDFVAIIGQSGSGKSTLMNIIGCLDVQTSGICRIDGRDTSNMDPDELADLRGKYLGFIFQRYNLLPNLSAEDNVALPAIYVGVPEDDRTMRAIDLLSGLELSEKTKNLPSQLSGGQQQRVSIARALMNGGRLILADEPTGALDSKSGEMVMEILENLHKQGHTIIMVTHDQKVASHASRIIEISDGRIISDKRNKSLAFSQRGANLREVAPRSRWHKHFDQLREAFFMSIQAILSHKMRSMLTMLGIIIGIASVVSVIALGKGSQEKIIADISSMGTNTIDILPGRGFGDRFSTRVKTLTVADCDILSRQSYIDKATPNTSQSGALVFGNQELTAQLNGVGEQYFDVKAFHISQGRLFTRSEVRSCSSYVVIDDTTYTKLFPDRDNPVGKTIIFSKKPLIIIGVLAKQERTFGPQSETLRLYSPYTTVMKKFTGNKYISSITVKIKDSVRPLMAEKSLTALLTARHGTEDFFTINTDSIKKTIESTTGTMRLLISGIALISLLVGGIGVMNIMLVSVTERTREIGVRMAVGARRNNILTQFLIEAVLICIIGGILGILASYLIGFVFSAFTSDFKMAYSIQSMLMALACSSFIGILFGFMPARNASRLNPIDALAYE